MFAAGRRDRDCWPRVEHRGRRSVGLGRDPPASLRRELHGVREAAGLAGLGIATIGGGALFATFSYITPMMTHLAGYAESSVTWLLVLFGLGMTVGQRRRRAAGRPRADADALRRAERRDRRRRRVRRRLRTTRSAAAVDDLPVPGYVAGHAAGAADADHQRWPRARRTWPRRRSRPPSTSPTHSAPGCGGLTIAAGSATTRRTSSRPDSAVARVCRWRSRRADSRDVTSTRRAVTLRAGRAGRPDPAVSLGQPSSASRSRHWPATSRDLAQGPAQVGLPAPQVGGDLVQAARAGSPAGAAPRTAAPSYMSTISRHSARLMPKRLPRRISRSRARSRAS